MPELPEVENARRILLRAGLPGRTITRAHVSWAPTVKFPSLEDFVLGLPVKRVETVERRGKYLLLPLDTGETFIIHLGMTGGLTIQPGARELEPMVRHHFDLDDGRILWFRDPRKFGHLWLTENPDTVLPALGPEPLSREFTADLLRERLGQRAAPVKALMLEQSVIAGLGNLYVDESLFLAGIHPARSASDLTVSEVATLRDCIVQALNTAFAFYDRAREERWPDPLRPSIPGLFPARKVNPAPAAATLSRPCVSGRAAPSSAPTASPIHKARQARTSLTRSVLKVRKARAPADGRTINKVKCPAGKSSELMRYKAGKSVVPAQAGTWSL